ncbi:22537_t:CDS:2 [Entrophospora sp. SA101]|nr:22537_t:CDS:2 [Entrophospora sp. SA101]
MANLPTIKTRIKSAGDYPLKGERGDLILDKSARNLKSLICNKSRFNDPRKL